MCNQCVPGVSLPPSQTLGYEAKTTIPRDTVDQETCYYATFRDELRAEGYTTKDTLVQIVCYGEWEAFTPLTHSITLTPSLTLIPSPTPTQPQSLTLSLPDSSSLTHPPCNTFTKTYASTGTSSPKIAKEKRNWPIYCRFTSGGHDFNSDAWILPLEHCPQ